MTRMSDEEFEAFKETSQAEFRDMEDGEKFYMLWQMVQEAKRAREREEAPND